MPLLRFSEFTVVVVGGGDDFGGGEGGALFWRPRDHPRKEKKKKFAPFARRVLFTAAGVGKS